MTKEEFWTMMGFKQTDTTYHFELTSKVNDWLRPDGSLSYDSQFHKGHLPSLDDLNAVVKWGVPWLRTKKLRYNLFNRENMHYANITGEAGGYIESAGESNNPDPKEALAEALVKALEQVGGQN